MSTSTPLEASGVGCGCADEGLAGAHLPHDVGALVGFQGEGHAPYGVGLGSQGGAEQLGEAVAVLGGPVEGRVGLHHPLGDGFFVGVDELGEVHWFSPSFYRGIASGCFGPDKGRGPVVLERTSGAS